MAARSTGTSSAPRRSAAREAASVRGAGAGPKTANKTANKTSSKTADKTATKTAGRTATKIAPRNAPKNALKSAAAVEASHGVTGKRGAGGSTVRAKGWTERPAGRTSSRTDDLRRSICPVACTLDLLGDRWTLLVVRDLALGCTRFRDFLASPEGIPTNILADRLERLVGGGLAERVVADDGSNRPAYRLTEKGESLRPILRAVRDWGLAWIEGTKAALDTSRGAATS